MAVMEPLRKSPRSTMRDKMALRSCSSAIRESGKLAPLLLTYHYVRNIATKKEPLIIPLSCRTPCRHAEARDPRVASFLVRGQPAIDFEHLSHFPHDRPPLNRFELLSENDG